MKKYESHAIAAIFPKLPEDQLATLADSIKADGLLEEIVLYEGKVLDGNNRQDACEIAKVKPRYREFGDRPGDGKSPARFVAAHNLNRRHLSNGERIEIAVQMAGFLEQENGVGKTEAIDLAAAAAGVSATTVKAAKALKKTDPEGFALVKKGDKTLNKAVKESKAKAPNSLPAEVLEKDETWLKEKRAEHGDVMEKIHGRPFADAFRKGVVLKSRKELDFFVKQPAADQKLIIDLVVKKWDPAKAMKFMIRELDGTNTLSDFLLQFLGLGKSRHKVTIDGHVFTVRKATEGG